MREVNDGRSQHRANGETDARPARSNGTLGFREPFADGFGVRRGRGGFGRPHKEAQDSEVQPASGPRVEDTHQRPDPGADHKANLQANNVNQPAAQGLENGVGDLERADYPGVLLGGDPEALFQFRGEDP